MTSRTEQQQAFESSFQTDLKAYLLRLGEVDDMLPDVPDIESLWARIGEAYLPEAMREFQAYPTVALGWVMYVGMAVAKYWDEDWERYAQVENLYVFLRDKQDFDHLDDYVRERVLRLSTPDAGRLQDIVAECASRTYGRLRHLHLVPASPEAFYAFVAALHQMYLMGAYMQLHRMGYHMTRLG